MPTYKQRRETTTTQAWKTWTNNGADMEEDMLYLTRRTALDATDNAFVPGISDANWLAATLRRLGIK